MAGKIFAFPVLEEIVVSLASQVNPIALLHHAVHFHFVFQDAAVAPDAPGRTDVVLVTDHQHPVDPQLFAFLQRQSNHTGGNAPAPLGGQHTVADVAAVQQQPVIQPVADIHRAHEDILLRVQTEECGVRHKSLRLILHIQIGKVIVKVPVIQSANGVRDDLLPRRVPLGHHIVQVPPVLWFQFYKL